MQKTNLLGKCIGIERRGQNNVFRRLQNITGKDILGIRCPPHIVNNCVQHSLDGLPFDVESIILKIYNNFSIYTVRTEALKDFCDFVEVEYKKLLTHSKTRWLNYVFPAVNRILQLYPAPQSYFASQDHPPILISMFFENSLNVCYLWFTYSLMFVFHSKIQLMEREKISLMEIVEVLSSIEEVLKERLDKE